MLLIRISSKRVFAISEYYILIPLMLAIELAIARKLKKKIGLKIMRNQNKLQNGKYFILQ